MNQHSLYRFSCIAISAFFIGGCASELQDISDVVPVRLNGLPAAAIAQESVEGTAQSDPETNSSVVEILSVTILPAEQQSKEADSLVPAEGVVVPIPVSSN